MDNRITPVQYSQRYVEAAEILEELNPCDRIVLNGVVSCYASRNGGWAASSSQLCCEGCKQLATSGCTVESLGCKLWLCSSVKATFRGREAADRLGNLGYEWDFGYRKSKQQFFQIQGAIQ